MCESCLTCRFWRETHMYQGHRMGECRPELPKVFCVQRIRIQEGEEAHYFRTTFPLTKSDTWCGYYENKE